MTQRKELHENFIIVENFLDALDKLIEFTEPEDGLASISTYDLDLVLCKLQLKEEDSEASNSSTQRFKHA